MSNPQMFMPNLTIKDKVNLPFLLANAVLNVQNAIIKSEGLQSEQEVRESVLCLYNLIPSSWIEEDEKAAEQLAKAVQKRIIDARPEWCGKKCGNKIFDGEKKNQIEEEWIEPYKLFRACVDILDRREMLSKKDRTEVIDGRFEKNDGTDSNIGDSTEEPEPEPE